MLGAVVPAAGQSRRMGQAKINLPWGATTVLGQVIQTLLDGGVEDLVVVTGEVEPAGIEAWPARARRVHLPAAAAGDMLTSLRFGLRQISPAVQAVLVMPADMPAVPPAVVRAVAAAWQGGAHPLVIPSFQMRRGHPWLLDRRLWPALFQLSAGLTLRDFLNQHAAQIHYVPVDVPEILLDLDTPEDYAAHFPQP